MIMSEASTQDWTKPIAIAIPKGGYLGEPEQ